MLLLWKYNEEELLHILKPNLRWFSADKVTNTIEIDHSINTAANIDHLPRPVDLNEHTTKVSKGPHLVEITSDGIYKLSLNKRESKSMLNKSHT